ncbi:MAG: DUF2723 domain-containing protein [bacterium]
MILISFFLIFLSTFSVYLFVVYPNVYVGDSGGFSASAFTLGISHPPGYPLWNVLGKLNTFIPLGNVAYRTNLFSGIITSLIIALIFLIIIKIALILNSQSQLKFITQESFAIGYFSHLLNLSSSHLLILIAAIIGSLALAFSPVFWEQAGAAEVYTLNLLFTILCILITILFFEKKTSHYLLLLFFLLGLGGGNHHTLILITPIFVICTITDVRSSFSVISSSLLKISLTMFSFILGFSIYIYLPIRASCNPAINCGLTDNLSRFIFHFLRKHYGRLNKDPRSFLNFYQQCRIYIYTLTHQFHPILLLIGLVGIIFLVIKYRHLFFLTTLIFIFTSLGFVYLLNFSISQRDIYCVQIFFIPSYAIFSIWIGVGGIGLIQAVLLINSKVNRYKIYFVVSLTIFFIIIAGPKLYKKVVNLSSTHLINNLTTQLSFSVSYNLGINIFRTMSSKSAYFAYVDNATFIPLYLHFIENKRPDITIYDWSGITLKNSWPFSRLSGESNQRADIELNIIRDTCGDIYYPFKKDMVNMGNYGLLPVGLLYKIQKYPNKGLFPPPNIWPEYHMNGINLYQNKSFGSNNKDFMLEDLINIYKIAFSSYLKENKETKIIKGYENKLKDNPRDIYLTNRLGILYGERKLYKEAIRIFLKGLEAEPKNLAILQNLALAYQKQENWVDAISTYKKILIVRPNDAETYRMCAVIYLKNLGNRQEALGYFQRCLEYSPDGEYAQEVREILATGIK